jgi:NitT/TauT family transport system substrate-binding protein
MKKLMSIVSIVSVIALMAAIFTGCQKKDEMTTLKVSEVTHSVFYAPQYVALSQGFFKEQGLEIELSNGQGADKVMTAVLTDQADIGLAGPEASVYVFNVEKKIMVSSLPS